MDKRWWTDSGATAPESAPVAAIYVLDRAEVPDAQPQVVELAGAARIQALLDVVCRPAFARGLGLERTVFATAATLARSVPVRRLVWPAEQFDVALLATRVEQDLAR